MNTNDIFQPSEPGIEPTHIQEPAKPLQDLPPHEPYAPPGEAIQAAGASGKADILPQHRKLFCGRGKNPPSEVTMMKEKWLQLTQEERKFWCGILFSKAKARYVRARIRKGFGIDLGKKNQLRRFRDWVRKVRKAEYDAIRNQEREDKFKSEHPEWSLDRVREEVIKESYEWNREQKEFRIAIQTIMAHCRVESNELNQKRYEDAKRTNEQKALDLCLEEARNCPEAKELFLAAFDALDKCKLAA